jgi:hypothetical protein
LKERRGLTKAVEHINLHNKLSGRNSTPSPEYKPFSEFPTNSKKQRLDMSAPAETVIKLQTGNEN